MTRRALWYSAASLEIPSEGAPNDTWSRGAKARPCSEATSCRSRTLIESVSRCISFNVCNAAPAAMCTNVNCASWSLVSRIASANAAGDTGEKSIGHKIRRIRSTRSDDIRACPGTTRTGQDACRKSFSATDPSNSRLRCLWPRVPTTSKSMLCSDTRRPRTLDGSPSRTRALDSGLVAPLCRCWSCAICVLASRRVQFLALSSSSGGTETKVAGEITCATNSLD